MEEVYKNDGLKYFYDPKKDRWSVRQRVESFCLSILIGNTAEVGQTMADICKRFQDEIGQPQKQYAGYFEYVPTVWTGPPYKQSREVTFDSFEFEIAEPNGDKTLPLVVIGTREPTPVELKTLTSYRNKKIRQAAQRRKRDYEMLKAEFEPKKIKAKDKPLKKIQVKSKAKPAKWK